MDSSITAAFVLGVAAQISLVFSGLFATWITVPNRIVGWLAAFGGGAGISAAFLAAVIISNIPQALAPSAELAAAGWSRSRLTVMWGVVVLACGLAAVLGFAVGVSGGTGVRMAALAAGGVLCMLTNSLVPFAYEKGGRWSGLWAVVGFALAIVPQ
jgi:ZIP family zinc transporter